MLGSERIKVHHFNTIIKERDKKACDMSRWKMTCDSFTSTRATPPPFSRFLGLTFQVVFNTTSKYPLLNLICLMEMGKSFVSFCLLELKHP